VHFKQFSPEKQRKIFKEKYGRNPSEKELKQFQENYYTGMDVREITKKVRNLGNFTADFNKDDDSER